MKILFLNSPMGNWVTWGNHISINPHLAQVSAYVRENTSCQVEALDARALQLDVVQTLEEIGRRKPDLIYQGNVLVTSGGAATVVRMNDMFRNIKAKFPSIITVVGGLMYSALPKEMMLETKEIDFIVVGETEATLAELLNGLSSAHANLPSVAGLAYKEGEEIILTAPRGLIMDLNTLPMPAYDLFPMEKYKGFSTIPNYADAITSRGCMGGCGFCYEWWLYDSRKPSDFVSYRTRSGKKVAQELEVLNKEYGIKTVHFLDDDFNASKDKVIEMCQEILKRDIHIEWFFMGRAGNYVRDMDIITLMKDAGCYFVLLGVEGSEDEERFRMLKGTSFEEIKESVKVLRKNGIRTTGTFMVGFWEDDEEAIKKRVETMDIVDPDFAALQILTPVPGSPVYRKAKAKGLIEVENMELWDIQHAIMPTKYLSRERLKELAAWAQAEFFKKPGRIERLMEDTHPCIRAACATYVEGSSHFAQDASFV